MAGQVQSSANTPSGKDEVDELRQYTSPTAERVRQRRLSANQKAAESFLKRHLPLGWDFTASEKRISLLRIAPVYTLAVAREDYLTASKAVLLTRAKKSGKRHECRLEFHVERHDDAALIRQKLRLYNEIRRDINSTYDRLKLKHLCSGTTVAECKSMKGPAGEAAAEYLTTRQILLEKLEVTPFYRIGTLYLYPLKNQCVTAERDWYFTNIEYPESEAIFPLEAREEIELILRNLEQLKLSQ